MLECVGFKPCVNKNSRILILGSMPSIKSLKEQQYYAHPQNRFWKLMAKLLNYRKTPEDYHDKIKMLLDNNIALWDAIASCDRKGSLDTAIQNEIPNDFTAFLDKYKSIRTICFNGGKSYQSFKKYNEELLKKVKYTYFAMPSTSPANARFRLDMLYEKWAKMFG
ncbi:DNA-deoxyinosine glycosylase [Pectinatus sottacetonis]|uniref:DNA-deoxyinosine glycosylase n=1 Tax=Pectinatus sottacetonis TaxID=1002795 RepID=UPI0018C4B12D|nr:DNA-deoxyinosine glycosylase [Pectinatus sottacetonis]